MVPAMADETELELLITVVVAAEDDRTARDSCRGLLELTGGRIVESGDCSDEEPGCWSVTISRDGGVGGHHVAAALSRAVRDFMRELGPDYTSSRVSCEPPTAWTVVEHPELVESLVTGGERLLVEAWWGRLPDAPPEPAETDPDEPATVEEPLLDEVDEHGRPRARLGLLVDVVTDRPAGAHWPARAMASRLSRAVTIVSSTERPPMVRVNLDLGPAEGSVSEIVLGAVSELGGDGWSRPRITGSGAVAHWSAASTPSSGIAAVELFAAAPDSVDGR